MQVPQLIENYRNGNAEAVSLLFLIVWFIGDIANLIGGVLAGLVPVIVAIAVYFCLADGVLIAQCLYYKVRNARRELRRRRRSSTETADQTTPLLGRRYSDGYAVAPESRRGSLRSRPDARRESEAEDTLAKIVEENDWGYMAWIKNFMCVLGVFAIGGAGWAIAWQTGMWVPALQEKHNGAHKAIGGVVLGYASAICYLGWVLLSLFLSLWLMLTPLQREIAPDLQKLQRQILRRFFSLSLGLNSSINKFRIIPPLLHPLPLGKLNLRRRGAHPSRNQL